MKLAIGISTVGKGINDLYNKVKNISSNVVVIISHQDNSDTKIDNMLAQLTNVYIITKNERGLSKSRNVLLDKAKTLGIDYLIISDDDVYYKNDGLELLSQHLIKEEHSSHYQFQSCDEANHLRKKYKPESYELKRLDVFSVSSIEMCINISLVKESNIRFDERFGLGSIYAAGEEPIFLSDALSHNHHIRFLPITVTIHPLESSGIRIYTDESTLAARGAIFKRCLGNVTGVLFVSAFWFKKFILEKKKIDNKIPKIRALCILIRGCFKNV